MNKTDAAKFLDISPRSLERYTTKGDITAAKVKGKTGLVADYALADLEQLKEKLASLVTAPTTATEPEVATAAPKPDTALARLIPRSETALARIGATSATRRERPATEVVPISQKRLLTIVEVAAITGLSAARIRTAIDAGHLKAGRVGRAFRVRPGDLDAWLERLF